MDEQTLRSQAQPPMARSATTLAGAQAKQQRQPSSSSSDLQQHHHSNRQQYHDNNNNGNGNGNNNNNGKVRLLITPAPTAAAVQTTDGLAYGSSSARQQMDRSATIITTTATLTTIDSPHQQYQQYQQQQQQQLRSQTLQNNRQKNYHHYDYYTDSDLTSSLTTTTQANNNSYGSNNYDQNILLFATEHNHRPHGNQPQQQPNQAQRADKLREQQRLHLAYGQPEPHQGRMASSASFAQQPQQGSPLNGGQLYGTSMQTGKFINYYPSWRQTQSPTTSHHHQNYSFHVPLQYGRRQQAPPPSRPQSRYGFVTPGGESRAKLSSRSSFKSRTLGHIPQSVRQEDPPSSGSVSIRLQRNKQSQEPEAATADEPTTEINYYDQPSLATRQFMLSEGDLLKVRQVVLEDGPENPFKPGTELSWEAEMMVRLMKRGYPIQELPALVESAKQVASSQHQQQVRAGDDESRASFDRAPRRRQSSHDLSGEMKQVWASSLSRARSMPRFYTTTGNVNKQEEEEARDADSIDLLIASIENEMVRENAPERDNEEIDNNNKALNGIATQKKTTRQRRSSSGPNTTRASMDEEASASALSQQLASSSAAPSAKQRQRKKSNERQRNTSEQQVVADRRNNSKTITGKSVAAVAVKPKQGKYNQQQLKVRGKKNSKADLNATNNSNNNNQIKKHTGCCTIQ